MLNRLQYKFMAMMMLMLTGRIFAAAKSTVEKYAYTVNGSDSKKVSESRSLSAKSHTPVISMFNRIILDVADACDFELEHANLNTISNSTVPFFFYDNGNVTYRQHSSAIIRHAAVQDIAGRWLLLSAAKTHEAHASLVALAGNASVVSAKSAVKALKDNGTTCVVINAEEFKMIITQRELADQGKHIDLPSIAVDPASQQTQTPSKSKSFDNCFMQ